MEEDMTKYILLACAVALSTTSGCSSKEKECPGGAEPAAAAGKGTPVADENWCRVCVRSQAGYFSCQRASGSEGRDDLMKKARNLACKDAGWTEDNCPDKVVFMSRCKGDPVPETNRDMKIKPVPIQKLVPPEMLKKKQEGEVSTSGAQASPASADIKNAGDEPPPSTGTGRQ